jgi:hypothetical protein
MNKPPLLPNGKGDLNSNNNNLNVNNMYLTIGGSSGNNNKLAYGNRNSSLGVSRQRSNPIAIRRKQVGESPENFWLSKSMPAPRAPLIGSMTEPSHLHQRIPDFSLPPTNPHISKSYGEVGTSMTRVSASMPNTSFMANAANNARRQFSITRDNEVFEKDLTKEEIQGINISLVEQNVKQPQILSRSIRSGSSGGTRTALSVLIEHPSESLLDELNLCKDDNEGRLLMEEVKKNNNKMSNSINMINDDSNVENRRSAMDEERGNLSLSDYELENDVNGDDDDDLFQMDE